MHAYFKLGAINLKLSNTKAVRRNKFRVTYLVKIYQTWVQCNRFKEFCCSYIIVSKNTPVRVDAFILHIRKQ